MSLPVAKPLHDYYARPHATLTTNAVKNNICLNAVADHPSCYTRIAYQVKPDTQRDL